MLNNKDKVNRIAGVLSLSMGIVIGVGYFSGIESILGFPNSLLLYALMPMVLVWFGTRKNACGSCNRSCSTSDPSYIKENSKNKETRDL